MKRQMRARAVVPACEAKRTGRGRPFGHGRHGGRRIPGPAAVPQEARGRQRCHEQDDADGDAGFGAGAEPTAATATAAAAAVTQVGLKPNLLRGVICC